MALLETWRKLAYETEMDQKNASEFWGSYFNQEKAIYEQILSDPDTVVKGTVKELAEKFGVEVLLMTGFLDGINDSLKTPNPIETMDENTEVSLDYDKENILSYDRSYVPCLLLKQSLLADNLVNRPLVLHHINQYYQSVLQFSLWCVFFPYHTKHDSTHL